MAFIYDNHFKHNLDAAIADIKVENNQIYSGCVYNYINDIR